MRKRHAAYAFGLCATFAPLLLLGDWVLHRDHARVHMLVVVVLACFGCVVHALARPVTPQTRHLLRGGFWLVLIVTWAGFWLVDLRHAQAQVVLVAVPVLALAGALLARSIDLQLADPRYPQRPALRGRPHAAHLAAGFSVPAFSLLWGIFLQRADNGCTGISDAYGITLFVTEIVVFLFGPSMIASHLAAALDVGEARTHAHSPYRMAERRGFAHERTSLPDSHK
ncbi:MAG: hypothetical protein KC731_03255 [Myxococcales bacterium]|nr:hypothetical protein [Myxococcales bacterium]